jgi:hypothetical protein
MNEKQLNMLKELCTIDKDSTRQVVGDKMVVTFSQNGNVFTEELDGALYDDFGMCKEI